MIIRYKIGKTKRIFRIKAENAMVAAKVLKKAFMGKEITIVGTEDETNGKRERNLREVQQA